MKTFFDKPSLTLFTVGLLFSKITSTIVTIKYSDVVISNENKSAIIRFTECDEFEIFLNNYKKKEWIIYYPLCRLSNLERLFNALFYVLECEPLAKSIPWVSIPDSYYKKLIANRKIFLDSFFCITNENFNRQYCIKKARTKYKLCIITPNKTSHEYVVSIFARSGDGNEDL